MQEPAANPGWRKSSYSNGAGSSCVEVGAIPWRKSSYSSNGGSSCVEVGAWRKSTHSGNGGDSCIEAGSAPGTVLVRDTTNRAGVILTIPAAAWRTLLAEIRG